jgi:hypothetical protein
LARNDHLLRTDTQCKKPDQICSSPIPFAGGCAINGAAVEHAAKQEPARDVAELRRDPVVNKADQTGMGEINEDASRFCPVCSQRLESKRCKLVCRVCGYFMSCADYY